MVVFVRMFIAGAALWEFLSGSGVDPTLDLWEMSSQGTGLDLLNELKWIDCHMSMRSQKILLVS